MYTCSNSIISTHFAVPNCKKDNEKFLNKHNRYLMGKVKESDVPFNIIKISKNKLEGILQNEVTMKISNKSSLQKNNSSSKRHEHLNLKKDWDRIPQEVREEVLKLSKKKKLRKCEYNCSCKYTQELIELYHNAQLLHRKAEKFELTKNEERFEINKILERLEATKSVEKLEINDNHEKLEINKNVNNDCCKKISISNVLLTKIENANFSVNKLKNLFEKVTEKLKIQEETNFQNGNYFIELKKKVQGIEKFVRNCQLQGKIFQLKKEQQTIDVAFMNQSLFLEEDELCKAKEEIQKRLKCEEELTKQDESHDIERIKERRIDTLLLLKSINLMDIYIEELKFQL